MPKLISKQEIIIEWSDFGLWKQRIAPKSTAVRSTGVHLSGIIKALMVDNYAEDTDPPLCVAEGLAWEGWVVGLPFCAGVRWQPGEWCCDEIYGTPDGLEKDVLWELKQTRLSMGQPSDPASKHVDPMRYNRWRWQVAGNLHAMGLEKVKLCVNWTNGNYKPMRGRLFVYEYLFPYSETSELWNKMILPNRELAKAEEHQTK